MPQDHPSGQQSGNNIFKKILVVWLVAKTLN